MAFSSRAAVVVAALRAAVADFWVAEIAALISASCAFSSRRACHRPADARSVSALADAVRPASDH